MPGAPELGHVSSDAAVRQVVPFRPWVSVGADAADPRLWGFCGVRLEPTRHVGVQVRVVEYAVMVGGQDVPEMFCLVTDLDDEKAYPYFAVEASFLPADPVCLAASLSASGHRTS
jgi:hypothetical protein